MKTRLVITNLDEVSRQGSYNIGPSKFHDFSMTIFTKIHDLGKLETTKRAEQGLRRTTGVDETQSLT